MPVIACPLLITPAGEEKFMGQGHTYGDFFLKIFFYTVVYFD
jgi:hypothetical protein